MELELQICPADLHQEQGTGPSLGWGLEPVLLETLRFRFRRQEFEGGQCHFKAMILSF